MQELTPRGDLQALGVHESFPRWIIGLDEVGAGCLAGPMYVAAAAIPLDSYFLSLNEHPLRIGDSKKLNEKQRLSASTYIQGLKGLSYVIENVSIEDIEKKNIYWARMEAFWKLIFDLDASLEGEKLFVVDGPRLSWPAAFRDSKEELKKQSLDSKVFSFSKADGNFFCVACAAILAKVERDFYMQKISTLHPSYAWQSNMGYATSLHCEAIKANGLTEFHRPSFCKNFT
jgi:ribonuclease HII